MVAAAAVRPQARLLQAHIVYIDHPCPREVHGRMSRETHYQRGGNEDRFQTATAYEANLAASEPIGNEYFTHRVSQ
jgi:hypothetical protein